MSEQNDFVPTEDELKRIGQAMKDPEFCKLLSEYAQEISDPENRKRYEEELRQLEAEQGNEVKFINPEPGYVLKIFTSKELKAFINICQSDVIDAPSSRKMKQNGVSGVTWSLPHSVTPHRDDLDKKGNPCIVYDVVFHPQALRLAAVDPRFKQLVEKTALDGIEQRFPHHRFNRSQIVHLKMKFKGMQTRSILRNKQQNSNEASDSVSKAVETKVETCVAEAKSRNQPSNDAKPPAIKKADITHKIIYRNKFDISAYRASSSASNERDRPTEIEVRFHIPITIRGSDLDLDVGQRSVSLKCQKLNFENEIHLNYQVDEDNGKAKFDRKKARLTVTLPIIYSTESKSSVSPDENCVSLAQDDDAVDSVEIQAVDNSQSSDVVTTDVVNNAENLTEVSMCHDKDPQEDTEPSGPLTCESSWKLQEIIDSINTEQTRETATLVMNFEPYQNIDMKIVERDVFGLTFHDIILSIISSNETPYQLTFRFDADINFESTKCSETKDNFVITIDKMEPMIWQRFQLNLNDSSHESVTFQTPESVRQEISNLADPWKDDAAEKALLKEMSHHDQNHDSSHDTSATLNHPQISAIEDNDFDLSEDGRIEEIVDESLTEISHHQSSESSEPIITHTKPDQTTDRDTTDVDEVKSTESQEEEEKQQHELSGKDILSQFISNDHLFDLDD